MKMVVYAVIAATTPKFTGNGHRRCESASAFGSCNMSLMMNVNGMTTTRMATTAADTHAGILAGAPALGSESALHAVTIRPIRSGPFTAVERGEIFLEQGA